MSVRPFSPCHLTQAMAGPIFSHVRKSCLTFSGGVHNFHGRLYPGPGRPYRGFPDCSSYQQTGWDPFPRPVEDGSRCVSVAADSRHSSSSHTHSGLPQCVIRQVISAEPAIHYRVKSPPRGRESDIQTVGNSSSEHVCHSPQRASSQFRSLKH